MVTFSGAYPWYPVSWYGMQEIGMEVVAIVVEMLGMDDEILMEQIIANCKRLTAMQAYAETTWILNPKLEFDIFHATEIHAHAIYNKSNLHKLYCFTSY